MDFDNFCKLPTIPVLVPCRVNRSGISDNISKNMETITIQSLHFRILLENIGNTDRRFFDLAVKNEMNLTIPKHAILHGSENSKSSKHGKLTKNIDLDTEAVYLPSQTIVQIWRKQSHDDIKDTKNNNKQIFISWSNNLKLENLDPLGNFSCETDTVYGVKPYEVSSVIGFYEFLNNLQQYNKYKIQRHAKQGATLLYGVKQNIVNFNYNKQIEVEFEFTGEQTKSKGTKRGIFESSRDVTTRETWPPNVQKDVKNQYDPKRNVESKRANQGETFLTHVEKSKRIENVSFGIQGYMNSCYMDSVLFSMYTYTTVFDQCFKPRHSKPQKNLKRNKEINEIIANKVIIPLRSKNVVPKETTQQLRKLLSYYNKDFDAMCMDAEDLLLTLATEVWDCPEFFRLSNDAVDFVYPIFVSNEGNADKPVTLSAILVKSLTNENVKLATIPNPAFVVKLPVSNGRPIFRFVWPNLELDLGELMVSPVKLGTNKMLLRAIICLKHQHFTCFVRINANKYSGWTYFDSMPTNGNPMVQQISGISETLETYSRNTINTMYLSLIVQHTYMCIYEPMD